MKLVFFKQPVIKINNKLYGDFKQPNNKYLFKLILNRIEVLLNNILYSDP